MSEFRQTEGSIGGFFIGPEFLADKGNTMGMASDVTSGDDVRFWAGAAYSDRATAPFNVTKAGILSATGAIISGNLTATTGTIAGFTISSTDISAGSGNSYAEFASDVSGKPANAGVRLGEASSGYVSLYLSNKRLAIQDYVSGGGAGQTNVDIGIDTTTNYRGLIKLFSNLSASSRIDLQGDTGNIYGYGSLTVGGTVQTASAVAWDVGAANAVSPTAPDRTLTVIVGGTTYYIHAKTTND